MKMLNVKRRDRKIMTDYEDISYFGDRLRKRRLELGMTQKELGEKLGLTDASITQYEKGKREPKRSILCKMANILEVDIDYFFSSIPKVARKDALDLFEYPNLFLPEHTSLAHRFVRAKRPLGSSGINFDTMTDEQAIAYANLISQADKRADEDAELYIFREALKKKQ